MISDNDRLISVLMDLAEEAARTPELDARGLAEQWIKKVKPFDLRELAIRQIKDWIDHYRREQRRDTEKSVTRSIAHTQPVARAVTKAQLTHLLNGKFVPINVYYQAVLDDPTGMGRDGLSLVNADMRYGFFRFSGKKFQEWHDVVRAGLKGVDLEKFDADWYREGDLLRGPVAYWSMRHKQEIDRMISDAIEETELRVTEGLLSTFFPLGDGTRVSWGQATIRQHEQRVEMLSKNAAGIVETATRHQKAIKIMKEAGIERLADLA